MRTVFIDSNLGAVLTKEADANDLGTLYKLIGCECITTFRLENGDTMILDDEGLINGTENFFELRPDWQPFAGNAVIVGPPDENGNNTEPRTTAWQIANRISFTRSRDYRTEYLDQLVMPMVFEAREGESFSDMLKRVFEGA